MVRWYLTLTLLGLVAARFQPAFAEGDAYPEAVALQAVPPIADDDDKDEADDEKAKKDEDSAAEEKADSDAKKESADDEAEADKTDKAKADEKSEKAEEGTEEKAKADEAKEEKKPGEEKTADKKAEEKKPEPHKVTTKDLKIEVEVDGVFVAAESQEVPLRPETWATFKVLEAVPHGARVRKGDVLVKFDDKEIDEALAEKSLQQRLGELTILKAEEEFPRLEKSIELNYEEAKRAYEQAVDEQERFTKTMRELSEKMAEYNFKSSEQQFQNAKEELDQLQKMYDADELTEETEEIVLKRQKFAVEEAKFYVDYSRVNYEYMTTVSIPRRAESLKTAVEMAKIEFDRAKMAKSLGMNEQRYQLQALREARARSVESFAKLEADRELMTLKSPADGIVYYGRCVNGRWAEVSAQESKLIPFGTVTPNSVVMTVVKERPLYVETSIGEKELPTVSADQPVTVAPAADSDAKVTGKVAKVANVPGGGNKFTVKVEIENDESPEWLMPGMTGKVKITTYDAKDVVVIPTELVQTDEQDDDKKYVMLKVKDEDKPVRRDVKLGKTKDKEVEVVDGLEEGDEIVKGAKDKSAEDKSEAKESDKK